MSLWGARCGKPARRVLRGEGGTRGSPRPPSTQLGLEFGQMFRRFGSRVTIVQRAGQLLPREDPDVADEITKILREDEVDVLLNAAKRVEGGVGRLTLTVTTAGAADRQFVGSHLPVAAGRAQARTISTSPLPASAPTGRATSQWTAGWGRTSPASTPWGT